MFEHVTIRATDVAAAERFYATVLETLGLEASGPMRWDELRLAAADSDRPATRRLHIGFAAPSRAHVDDFWRVGTQAGHPDDGPPGPRPRYRHDYYGSFLLDPDGNSAEAVHHGALRGEGSIDHLWIRVSDVAAARDFYAQLAPRAGLRLDEETPELVRFSGSDGSFSLVAGRPSEHVHMGLRGEADEGPLTDPDGNLVEIVRGTAAP